MAKCEERRRTADVDAGSDDGIAVDTSRDDAHLDELPDGAGCTGIWEYLSSKREPDDD